VDFQQFDLSAIVRCKAVDTEGFQCLLRPNHDGPHRWARCDYEDGGHRCFLPPRHPGRHEFAWFDRPTVPGAHHTVHYSGTEEQCRRRFLRDEQVFEAKGWRLVSAEFRASMVWRSPWLRPVVSSIVGPAQRGSLEVVYEFGGAEEGRP